MSKSLGWLTESAFLPQKESKKITVGQNSSLVDLKAKILEEKAKLTRKHETGQTIVSSNYKKKDIFKQEKNKGVEDRNNRDEIEEEKNAIEDSHGRIDEKKIQFKLAEKAQIYEQLMGDKQAHVKGKHHLVDYEQKRWSKP